MASSALTPTVHQAIYLRKLPPGSRSFTIFEGTSDRAAVHGSRDPEAGDPHRD